MKQLVRARDRNLKWVELWLLALLDKYKFSISLSKYTFDIKCVVRRDEMAFNIKCSNCKYEEEKNDAFSKKDDISIEITGEEIVRIRCNFCGNEIFSHYDC